MKKILAAAALAALIAPAAQATVVSFDFAAGGSDNTLLGTSVTDNGVTAEGFYTGFNSTTLWRRNAANEHGLGVCSEGESACVADGDLTSELDSNNGMEGIRLTNSNPATQWTSLTVSSLDSNLGTGYEWGAVYWSDCADFSGAAGCNQGKFFFHYGDFGAAFEGDVLSLARATAKGFNPDAEYLLIVAACPADPGSISAGTTCDTTNNDFLVWGGSVTQIPEPATIALLGLGLTGLGFGVRRRSRK